MPADDTGALRREHDALAAQLSARRSVDEGRKAAYAAFFGFITLGLSVKLAWDRWFSERLTRFDGPPLFFFVALAMTAVLAVIAVVAFTRARRHMRGEDEAFARFKELRARLGIDP
jgi:hypothetical protein